PITGTRPRSWKPGVRDVLLLATCGHCWASPRCPACFWYGDRVCNGRIREIQAALSTAWVSKTDSTLMWRDSRSPDTSAKRLIDSMTRFTSFAGISCTLTVSSRLYFAVFAWSLADCGFWLRTVPPNIRKRLIRERLPQTVHASCGLLLMVSQSAQNTALRRGTALKPPSVWAPAFISEPLIQRCSHAKFGFAILQVPTPDHYPLL